MSNPIRRLFGLVAVGLSLGLGPAVAPAQTVLHDDRGQRLEFAAPPARIVSLLPSLTESVCALGACGRLVGTDRFSNWPASVLLLPKLGGLDDAQVERIVSLKPDVVLATASARVTGRLEALGVTVVVLESRNRAEVRHGLDVLAAMLGTPTEAGRLWGAIERATREAAARVPPELRGGRVYFEVDTSPYAAGAGSFIGETLTALGMANAVPAELGPFPKLNPEYVVRTRPDIIMAAGASVLEMGKRPGWSSLAALQNGRTCGFSPDRYELLIRPGPRMGEAAGVLADCLVAISKGSPGPSPSPALSPLTAR